MSISWDDLKASWVEEDEWRAKHPVKAFFKELPNRIKYQVSIMRHRGRMVWQLMTRGYSDEQWWDYDNHASKWALPRLRALRANTQSYPHKVGSLGSWLVILDRIIEAHELVVNSNTKWQDEDTMAKFKAGMSLYAEHYLGLWD